MHFRSALMLVSVVTACASASGGPPPASPIAAAPSDETPSADRSCLTLRDAELGCVHACESLTSAMRSCAAPLASGRITIDWRYEGEGPVRYELRLDGEHLDRVAPCVEATFARYVPCQEGDQEGSLPLLFSPG